MRYSFKNRNCTEITGLEDAFSHVETLRITVDTSLKKMSALLSRAELQPSFTVYDCNSDAPTGKETGLKKAHTCKIISSIIFLSVVFL